ncbi:MAG: hypothetical protein MUF21_07925 [Gemmatimonadaceae bacterium]|nr:hypothetical protein [Gemmatimonadaceae bacterium]
MTIHDFEPMLAASAATPAFRAELAAFAAGGDAERIEARAHNPRVKILRTCARWRSSCRPSPRWRWIAWRSPP